MNGCFQLRAIRSLALASILVLLLCRAAAGAPESRLFAGAKQEKELVIYAAIDRQAGEALVRDFSSLYPGIRVYLVAMTGTEVFSSHMQDVGRRQRVADLLWSGDVELQAALVKDGYAAPYRAMANEGIFHWANRYDLVYAVAHEPVAMVYNRSLLADKALPTSHGELLRAVKEDRFRGRIATVDPGKNGRAFINLVHDQASDVRFWSLVQGFGAAGIQICTDFGTLLDSVASGETAFGYNVPAGEAFRRARQDPAVGVLYFDDYTLSIPQTIVIAKDAPHPNAARLWIEYILSVRGQEKLSRELNLFPVRADVAGGENSREPLKLPSGRGLKVMMPERELARFTERGIRRGVLVRWQEMLRVGK